MGCSCLPSPALTIAALHQLETSSEAPAHGVRSTIASGLWALSVSDGVLQRLPLLDARAAGGEVDDVGRQALGGQLEGAAGARGGLVEEVQHHPPAQRGDLLDLALGDLGEALGLGDDPLDAGAVEFLDREQVVHVARRHRCRLGDRDLVHAVELAHPHVDVLGGRGRQVLADVVGADRQLAVAAVDQHRQLHPLGAAVGEQRLDRGPHGAPGVEHVVDDHDRAGR